MKNRSASYKKGFIPYALAAFLIGIVGGFSTVLGPAFVQDIGAPNSSTTWTALAQAMSTAACAPVLGRMGDIIGRRTTLLLGMAVFTLGNVLSALAGSLPFMLAARFTVGLGTAAMTPVIMAYIVTQFPPERAANGFSLYMLISSASVILGPTLGGLITAGPGWRVMLWVCSGICVITLALCLALGGGQRQPRRPLEQFDVGGAVLVPVFFSLVLCIPSFGQNFGWTSGAFSAVLLLSAASLAGLIAAEKHAAQPILSGSFIRRRAFVLSTAALFLTQGLMQANMTNVIIFVRSTQPENSVVSGYAISVMYLGMSLGAVLLGPLADRFEPKHVLTGSLLLTGAGCAGLFAFSADSGALMMMAALGLLGLGLGGNGTVFMKVVLVGLPPHEAGAGTGTYGLFRDLAAPFGVAVFVPLFTNRMSALSSVGVPAAEAAVRSIRMLAAAELICAAAGMAAVLFLPKIHEKGEPV